MMLRPEQKIALENIRANKQWEIESQFWSIVDREGLTGLPSDMWEALEILVSRAAGKQSND